MITIYLRALDGGQPPTSRTRASNGCRLRITMVMALAWVLVLAPETGMGGARAEAPGADPMRLLFDFDAGLDGGRMRATDAEAAVRREGDGGVLQVRTRHGEPWPGVTLTAPAPGWDLSSFARVVATVRNLGSNSITVHGRVDNEGADGRNHCVTASVKVGPGGTQTLRVDLTRFGPGRLGGKLFGMRGYPVAWGGEGTVDPARVSQLLFFVHRPESDQAFVLDDIRAEGASVRPTAGVTDADPYFPFIDTFGQYRHRDWPGKVHSVAELERGRVEEEAELRAASGLPGWDRYGGWAEGPALRATGFFRTEKIRGRWWLVDPDGRLFFSHGIDCVGLRDASAIEERAEWFDAFPGSDGPLAEFWVPRAYALKGHYAGRSPRSYSFAGANLRRKYGPDWRALYPGLVQRRLRSWGLNTIGNWSDDSVRRLRRTPYTDAVSSSGARWIEGSEGYWGKFPDPYDPSFRAALERSMRGASRRSAEDPWCLGYFSDNELSWGDELSLALAALRSPAEQAAKKALAEQLKATHGTIGRLNAAWGTSLESWEALLASRAAPELGRARPDLERFATALADEYFRTVRAVIREAAPHHLYLGCRFAWANARAAAAAARHCDVVSYNLYQREIASFEFSGGADVPLLVGEFHFGALDRGLFHPGLVPVASQAERADAYARYVRGALRHPQFVGVHWFQYQDEPTTGRVYDEENYQIGFVDIADTPYRETIAAARDVGRTLYSERWAGAEGQR